MLVTYPYASMASTWDNRDPGQREPYGTKGSYLWDNRDSDKTIESPGFTSSTPGRGTSLFAHAPSTVRCLRAISFTSSTDMFLLMASKEASPRALHSKPLCKRFSNRRCLVSCSIWYWMPASLGCTTSGHYTIRPQDLSIPKCKSSP